MKEQQSSSILQIPELDPFQFSSDRGNVDNSVNLFRGDVCFTLPLLYRKGRNGLDINISALYSSNVSDAIRQRNLEAPVSILGLGWTMPVDRIKVTRAEGIENKIYYFVRGGTRSRLFNRNRPWIQGYLESEYKDVLDQGVLDDSVRNVLLNQGIIIGQGGKAELLILQSGEKWRILDRENERIYLLCLENRKITVYDGGRGYELQAYNYSRIQYYEEFEKWEVTDCNGIRHVFGGQVQTDEDGISSAANESVCWEVGIGNWRGSGMVTHSPDTGKRLQRQMASAWYFSASLSPWGDAIRFEYWQKKQPVGQDGLPYTKEIQLSRAVDTYGSDAIFCYGKKVWESGTESPREYADPYKPIPDDKPDAFQSCYETSYLSRINIFDGSAKRNHLLYSLDFSYELNCYQSGLPERHLYGDLCKRTLVSVRKVMGSGAFLPGIEMIYYGCGGIHPGALERIIYPEGASITYDYVRNELNRCSRDKKISSPMAGSTPRVWFGREYAVVTWKLGTALHVKVCTWSGGWIEWSPAQPVLHASDTPVDCCLKEDFFVLHYEDKSQGESNAYLFHKDPDTLGGWLEYKQSAPITTYSHQKVNYSLGDDFLAVSNQEDKSARILLWDHLERSWADVAPDFSQFLQLAGEIGIRECCLFDTCAGNAYVQFLYDSRHIKGQKKSRLFLYWLDEAGHWQIGDSLPLPELDIYPNNPGTGVECLDGNLQWAVLPWAVAASYVTGSDKSNLHYRLTVFGWKDSMLDTPYTSPEFSIGKAADGGLPVFYAADAASESMLVAGTKVLRFNGKEWLLHDGLDLETKADQNSFYWFSNDSDIVIKTENTKDRILGRVLYFDPDMDSFAWNPSHMIQLFDSRPDKNRSTDYFSSATEHCLTWNTSCYKKEYTSDWSEVLGKQPFFRIPEGSDTTTIVNHNLHFFVYMEKSADQKSVIGTRFVTLNNGVAESSECIRERYISLVDTSGHFLTDVNGKAPGSGSTFLTYLPIDKDFEQAQSVTLHRFTGMALQKPVEHFAVSKTTLDNGYEKSVTHYEYDPANAVCDSFGRVAKYYKTKAYKESPQKNGYSIYYFYNAVSGRQRCNGSENYSSYLDGTLYRKEVFDAGQKLVASYTTDYEVVHIVGEKPGEAGEIPIYGGIIRILRSSCNRMGVVSTVTHTYDPCSGGIRQIDTALTNAYGQTEHQIEYRQYGYECPVYGFLSYRNWLSLPVLQKTMMRVDEAVTVLAATANTVKLFEVPGQPGLRLPVQYEKYIWKGKKEAKDFDFERWAAEHTAVPEWLRVSVTEQIDAYGNITRIRMVDGKTESKLYASDGKAVIASFPGASYEGQEAYYYGFEQYEASGIWEVDSSLITDETSFTGGRSLLIRPGQVVEKLCLTPENWGREYVFSCWAKVEAPGACGWIIRNMDGGICRTEQKLVFQQGKEWQYCYAILKPFQAGTWQMQLFNDGAGDVFCDQVGFAPLDTPFTAMVYEPGTNRILAHIGPYHAVQRTLYDELGMAVVQTGDCGEVLEMTASFLSRQVNASFCSAEPNSTLSIRPMGKTYLGRFNNQDELFSHWTSPKSRDWSASQGELRYEGTGSGELTLTDPDFPGNYAARICLKSAIPSAGQVGLKVGQELLLQWLPDSKQWFLQDLKNERQIVSREKFLSPCGDWVLVLSQCAVLFFAGSRKVFSYLPPVMVKGSLSICASFPCIFSGFAAGLAPQAGIQFFNGSGQQIQGQSLEEDSVVLKQTLYNQCGVPLADSLPARLKPAAGLLSYCQEAVTDMNWETGVMQGAIAACYPDAQGFPYSGKLLEASPLQRTAAVGMPGKDFAVTGAHGMRYTYSANSGEEPGYPAGKYYRTDWTDQNGNAGYLLKDSQGKEVFRAADLGDGRMLKTGRFYSPSARGGVETVRLPNYYHPPEGSKPEDWLRVSSYDTCFCLISTREPGGNFSEYIYDSGLRLRFSQNNTQASKGMVLYKKYDDYHRLVEEGFFYGGWERDWLQEKAEKDPLWPGRSDGAIPKYRFTYHGDRGDIHSLGNLTMAEVYSTEAPEGLESRTRLRYDGNQRIVWMEVEKIGTPEVFITEYAYDNLGNPAKIRYPSGLEVIIGRDEAGRISSTATTNGKPLGRYSYTADDQLLEEVNLVARDGAFTTRYTYTLQGWLKQCSNRFMTEDRTYSENAFGGGGYYNGVIASKTVTAAQGQAFTYRYAYDKMNRLTSAAYYENGQLNNAWSVGAIKPVVYDDNGNILEADQMKYIYYPGTDKVMNTRGTTDEDYTWNENGEVVSAASGNIARILRDVYTGKPRQIALEEGDVLELSYDARDNRLSKTGPAEKKYYGRDFTGLTVGERKEQEGKLSATDYFYGPGGMLGFCRNGAFYGISRDQQNSPLAVIGNQGSVEAAYGFTPYGIPIPQNGRISDLLDYLFCGYEYDRETGLYHTGARLYDPKLRSFYEPDPQRQFASPYLFTGNNPINMVDPNGEAAWWTITSAVLGTLAAIALTCLTAGAAGETLAAAIGSDAAIGATTVAADSASEDLINMGTAAVIGTASALIGDMPGIVTGHISGKEALTNAAIGAGVGASFAGVCAAAGRTFSKASQAGFIVELTGEGRIPCRYVEEMTTTSHFYVGFMDMEGRLATPRLISGFLPQVKNTMDVVAVHGLPGKVIPTGAQWLPEDTSNARAFADFIFFDGKALLARRTGPVKCMICYGASDGPNGEQCVAKALANRFKRTTYGYPYAARMYEGNAWSVSPNGYNCFVDAAKWAEYHRGWKEFRPSLFRGHFGRFGFFGI